MIDKKTIPVKFTGIILLLFLLVACSDDRQTMDDWKSVRSQGKGDIVLYYVPSEGFAYYRDDGSLTGVTADIFYDFVEWVSNEYGFDINVHKEAIDSWSDFYTTVVNSASGTFGMGNVTITNERMKELDFSPPYMTNIAVLITHLETPELSSFDNLKNEFGNLDALAFKGTLHEKRLVLLQDKYYPDLSIKYAQSNNEIIERIVKDNLYFAYIDVYNYWRARESGLPVRRHSVGDQASEQFGYILPDNSDWTPIINEFFQHDDGYLNSKRYREIMEKHLGKELSILLETTRDANN